MSEVSRNNYKLGNDFPEYQSNTTATIGFTFDRYQQQGGVKPQAVRPGKTAISLGQDPNMYQINVKLQN